MVTAAVSSCSSAHGVNASMPTHLPVLATGLPPLHAPPHNHHTPHSPACPPGRPAPPPVPPRGPAAGAAGAPPPRPASARGRGRVACMLSAASPGEADWLRGGTLAFCHLLQGVQPNQAGRVIARRGRGSDLMHALPTFSRRAATSAGSVPPVVRAVSSCCSSACTSHGGESRAVGVNAVCVGKCPASPQAAHVRGRTGHRANQNTEQASRPPRQGAAASAGLSGLMSCAHLRPLGHRGVALVCSRTHALQRLHRLLIHQEGVLRHIHIQQRLGHQLVCTRERRQEKEGA